MCPEWLLLKAKIRFYNEKGIQNRIITHNSLRNIARTVQQRIQKEQKKHYTKQRTQLYTCMTSTQELITSYKEHIGNERLQSVVFKWSLYQATMFSMRLQIILANHVYNNYEIKSITISNGGAPFFYYFEEQQMAVRSYLMCFLLTHPSIMHMSLHMIAQIYWATILPYCGILLRTRFVKHILHLLYVHLLIFIQNIKLQQYDSK